jgi:hypothetical protein
MGPQKSTSSRFNPVGGFETNPAGHRKRARIASGCGKPLAFCYER